MFCNCKSLKNQCYRFFLSFFWFLKATCMPTINSINKFLVDYIMKFPTKVSCKLHSNFNQDLLQYAWKNSNKISNKLHFRKFCQHFLQSSHMENFQPRFLCKLQLKKINLKFSCNLHEEFPKQSIPYKFLKNPNNCSKDIFYLTIFQSFINPCNLGILHVQQNSTTISTYFYLKLSNFQNTSLTS